MSIHNGPNLSALYCGPSSQNIDIYYSPITGTSQDPIYIANIINKSKCESSLDQTRIRNIFKNLDTPHCGHLQLQQLSDMLEQQKDVQLKFAPGQYSAMMSIEEGKTIITFTIPKEIPDDLHIPCANLDNLEISLISLKEDYHFSKEEIEAYLMGHEIFHAISQRLDLKGSNEQNLLENIRQRAFNYDQFSYLGSDDNLKDFFGNENADDVNNLFGLKTFDNNIPIISEFDYLQEITGKNVVRFPYDILKAPPLAKDEKTFDNLFLLRQKQIVKYPSEKLHIKALEALEIFKGLLGKPNFKELLRNLIFKELLRNPIFKELSGNLNLKELLRNPIFKGPSGNLNLKELLRNLNFEELLDNPKTLDPEIQNVFCSIGKDYVTQIKEMTDQETKQKAQEILKKVYKHHLSILRFPPVKTIDDQIRPHVLTFSNTPIPPRASSAPLSPLDRV